MSKDHLFFSKKSKSKNYKPTGNGGSKFRVKSDIDPEIHGKYLYGKLEDSLVVIEEELKKNNVDDFNGYSLDFYSHGNYELKYESLKNKTHNIELLNIQVDKEGKSKATVFVPKKEKQYFTKKTKDYLTKKTKYNKESNKDLIESIANVLPSKLESLWMDKEKGFPINHDDDLLWEVWFRKSAILDQSFDDFDLELQSKLVEFPDRKAGLLKSSVKNLTSFQLKTNSIASLYSLKEIPKFFGDLNVSEQDEYCDDLSSRIRFNTNSNVAISILDTGVNNSHPLLSSAFDEDQLKAFNVSSWGLHDHDGHGTAMAGIALFGEQLKNLLLNNQNYSVEYCIESGKIMAPPGREEEANLNGVVTLFVVDDLCQSKARKRIFCLAITEEYESSGEATLWSAIIDQASFDQSQTKLFCISAGNVRDSDSIRDRLNSIFHIESPAQAWNAITVGAQTSLTEITSSDQEFEPIASEGELSPTSRTSFNFQGSRVPNKPDVVFEGGNWAKHKASNEITNQVESLRLLSLSVSPDRRLCLFGDTSGATAQASRLAAKIQSKFPNYWSESTRGLIIHSADFHKRLSFSSSSAEKEAFMCCYGYGLPNENEALGSDLNRVTFVYQDELIPFKNKKSYKMNLHTLPWPKKILEENVDKEVELKITLSYYIEPNLSDTGFIPENSYFSHGLRFSLKRPLESQENFLKRINKAERDENEEFNTVDTDRKWLLGRKLRDKGSVISDVWKGTAPDLANQNEIIIYPIGGWWKNRKVEKLARYSLIVSLRVNENIDLYSEVESQISITV